MDPTSLTAPVSVHSPERWAHLRFSVVGPLTAVRETAFEAQPDPRLHSSTAISPTHTPDHAPLIVDRTSRATPGDWLLLPAPYFPLWYSTR